MKPRDIFQLNVFVLQMNWFYGMWFNDHQA